jgi:tape measure domain-containing protein
VPKVGTAYVSIRARLDSLEKDLRDAKNITTRHAQDTQRAVSNVFRGAVAYLGVQQIRSFGQELFAAGRQIARTEKAFTEISGSAAGMRAEFDFLRQTSDDLGQNFYDLQDAYKGVLAASKGTSMEGQGVRDAFRGIVKASATLGLSSEDVKLSLYAVQQMMSKGKVSAEELRRQLGERLPGAFNLAAEAMGVTAGELDKMLKDGTVLSDVLIPKLARLLEERYTGQVDAATRATNKWNEAWFGLKAAIAEGDFLDQAAESMRNLTETIKDPSFRAAMREIVGFMAGFATDLINVPAAVLSKAGQEASTAMPRVKALQASISEANELIAKDYRMLEGWQAKVLGRDTYEKQIESHKKWLGELERELALYESDSWRRSMPNMPAVGKLPPPPPPPSVTVDPYEIEKARGEGYDEWMKSLNDIERRAAEWVEDEFDAAIADYNRRMPQDLGSGTSAKDTVMRQLEDPDYKAWSDFQREMIEKKTELDNSLKDSFDEMQELSEHTAESMQDAFGDLFFDAMQGRLDTFGEYFDAFMAALQRSFAQYMSQMLMEGAFGKDFKGSGWLSSAVSWMRGLWGGGAGMYSGATGSDWGMYADGGLITEPVIGMGRSGRRYAIGEGGEAEWVIPASKMGGGMTIYMNYSIQALDTGGASEIIRRNSPAVADALVRELKHSPALTNYLNA